MSHVAAQECKPGEPMYKDMEALEMACKMCGLEIEHKKTYTWFDRHVGDYPLPKGMTKSELGKNAVFVIKLNAEMTKLHGRANQKPYELGMVEDPNNPGCFVPIYDFFMGGYGLDACIGEPVFADGNRQSVKLLAPRLKKTYDMCCDKLAAQAAGDHIEFLTLKSAHEKYPRLFPNATTDEETWVSIADPSARMEQIEQR